MVLEQILEILKYTIPGLIVFFTAYLILKSMLNNEYKKVRLEMQISKHKEALPIRLNAYERLALFIERISPVNLLQRVRQPNMSAKEMQMALISSIRMEYDHNITQQIYVSPQVWAEVCLARDEVVKLVNMAAAELHEKASAKDLSKLILSRVMESEDDGFSKERVLEMIKKEVREVFG